MIIGENRYDNVTKENNGPKYLIKKRNSLIKSNTEIAKERKIVIKENKK
jgi:hypothetical protein